MEIKNIKITSLKPAKYNPRKISRTMLKKLKDNIKSFGLVDPLVVNSNMTIIGGHQRYKACLELGFEEMPCVVLELSESKERALNLALNKITGDWDKTKLEKLLDDLNVEDIILTGFSDDELSRIVEDINIESPEYDIAPRMMEEYNYIVLFFRNTLDFQVATDHFGLEMKKEDSREKVGLGKVIDGSDYLKRINK
jgi:site-specific DNA-methyltransferase (adenine-specific)